MIRRQLSFRRGLSCCAYADLPQTGQAHSMAEWERTRMVVRSILGDALTLTMSTSAGCCYTLRPLPLSA